MRPAFSRCQTECRKDRTPAKIDFPYRLSGDSFNAFRKNSSMKLSAFFAVVSTSLALLVAAEASDFPFVPVIGEWWTVATDPDLGELTTPHQQPVDFAIWRAADGTWQIWSCVRGTKEPGKTRLFHRWEGARLQDTNWTPKGIALHADPTLGELPGGLQAPHVIQEGGMFKMFYGDWVNICLATSQDGKTFARHRGADGKPQLFHGPSEAENTRDPMLIKIGGLWHCYYTAHPGKHGSVYVRTSKDLLTWDEPRVVAFGGQAGDHFSSAECPFVVEVEPGHFYLFRTQKYGKEAKTSVYHSNDPLNFGIDDDARHLVTVLPIAAPEIIQQEGKWFIAALLPNLKGIQIAPLEWKPAK
jgi:hypothetical protein